jgi:hypothetical protein
MGEVLMGNASIGDRTENMKIDNAGNEHETRTPGDIIHECVF